MNPDPEVDVELVRRLIGRQFPAWAGQGVTRIGSAGVDNHMFRLGSDLVVRLPARASSVGALEKEQVWLPRLAPDLPLAVPQLAGAGRPCEEFPWPWSVNAWIEGVPTDEGGVSNWARLAVDLAGFVRSLHRLDASDGPRPGEHNFWRGVGLHARNRLTREAIDELADQIDGRAALFAWEADSEAPPWPHPPLWVHGDLHAQNLLQRDGRLHAVIDFGGLGVGDPACDVAVAWRLLPRETRNVFRQALQVDDDTWRRGRAWALSVSLRELSFYRGAAPRLESIAARTIAEVVAEHEPSTP